MRPPAGDLLRAAGALTALSMVWALWVAAAFADYPADDPAPELDGIASHISAGDYRQAEFELRRALEAQSEDADILNLLGYVTRKQGNFVQSRIYYERALAIDPVHRGALEYMGELELQTGDPAAAARLRTRLQAVCPTGCEELDALDAAFARHGL